MLSITYDPLKDARNWLRIARNYGATFQLTKNYPFDRTTELTEGNLQRIATTIPPHLLAEYRQMADAIMNIWNKREETLTKKITGYLKIPHTILTVRAVLTTAYRMPYDFKDRWFMVPACKPLDFQLRVIMHELFHFYMLQDDPSLTRSTLEKSVEIFLQKLPPFDLRCRDSAG